MVTRKLFLLAYLLIVYLHITLRISRDVFLVQFIGVEASSAAKIISFLFIPIFMYFIRKIESKKTEWFLSLSIFFIGFSLFFMNKIPSIDLPFLPKYFAALFKNFNICVYYILSELFPVFINGVFWNWCNNFFDKKTSYKDFFIISQLGAIAAALNTIFTFWPIRVVILLFFGSLFFLAKFLPTIEKQDKKIDISGWKKLLFIPINTILCGVIMGLFDPLTKFCLLTKCGPNYKQYLSFVWIIQSISVMFFNFFLSSNSFLETPMFIFFSSLIIILFKILGFDICVLVAIFLVIIKSLKYSSFMPAKEKYLTNAKEKNQISIIDSCVCRFGKTSVAVVLAIIFNLGLSWKDIYFYVIIVIGFFAALWIFVIYERKKFSENN